MEEASSGGNPGGDRAPVSPPERADSPRKSAREVLADYRGSEWPEHEAAILEKGMDLDQPFEIVPWESAALVLEQHVPLSESAVEGQIVSMLEWPEEPSIDELENSISVRVPGEKLDGVVHLAEPYNDRIREVAGHWARLLEIHVNDRWLRGDFQKAPFSTFGMPQEQGFYSKVIAGSGWAAVITLTEEECPDMMEVRDEIEQIRQERFAAIVRYVRE